MGKWTFLESTKKIYLCLSLLLLWLSLHYLYLRNLVLLGRKHTVGIFISLLNVGYKETDSMVSSLTLFQRINSLGRKPSLPQLRNVLVEFLGLG